MNRQFPSGIGDAARKNVESFSQRAARFTEKTLGEALNPLRLALERIGFGPGQWAADFGVGTGNSAIPFLEAGGDVLGLDVTPAMVQKGMKRLTEQGFPENAHFILATCEQTPIANGSVDCAVCRNVFHHLAAPSEVVREMARVVRPGGHVIVMDHCYPDSDDERRRIEEIDHIREPVMVRILSLKDFRTIYVENGLEVITAEATCWRDSFDNWISGAETPKESIPAVREGVEGLRDEGGGWMDPQGHDEGLSLLRWDAIVVGRKE